MGIPYSREINAAFEQVTPLVAAGFEVLQTTKDIAILLACIQVLTVAILALILVSLFGLLLTMNPDLEYERQQLVTPALQYISSWLLSYGASAKWLLRTLLVATAIGFVVFFWYGFIAGSSVPGEDDRDGAEEEGDEPEEETKGKGNGKDKHKGQEKRRGNGKDKENEKGK
ncbi:uncharacterized protein A1O9_11658 [Exophiala aquamarina CBS 119918]|uniref:Uncharacterized protein n=1 Tax=Exophiala aquamarina CBS 119918 TaxID=1182545 RepID=A0A072NYD0_9EURO|nr:uncharacterized protein A1O9_11658 [Exophiala aquamarina CBS 119918]KEF52417.1 hypothetical protein A1O9_11658 [Exophiala aquamarina CBS 119918]